MSRIIGGMSRSNSVVQRKTPRGGMTSGTGAQGQPIVTMGEDHPNNPTPGRTYSEDSYKGKDVTATATTTDRYITSAPLVRGPKPTNAQVNAQVKAKGYNKSMNPGYGTVMAPDEFSGRMTRQPSGLAAKNRAKKDLNQDVYKGTTTHEGYGLSTDYERPVGGSVTPETKAGGMALVGAVKSSQQAELESAKKTINMAPRSRKTR